MALIAIYLDFWDEIGEKDVMDFCTLQNIEFARSLTSFHIKFIDKHLLNLFKLVFDERIYQYSDIHWHIGKHLFKSPGVSIWVKA